MRSGRLIVIALAVLALLVGGCGGSTTSSDSTPAATHSAAMKPADFSVEKYRGKPLVVNFFGSWCGPCNSEAPELASFARAHPEVQFVAIAVQDSESKAQAFMNKYGLTFPLVIDDNSLSQKQGIRGVPTTFFYDKSGKIVDQIVGGATRAALDKGLAKATAAK